MENKTTRGFSKEWCLKMAELEGDAEIGAGLLASDPVFVGCPMPDDVCADCGYRCCEPPPPAHWRLKDV
jgi:hypothetical protein